jgi:hypothetical protein
VTSARNCLVRSVIAERLDDSVDTVCSPALDGVSCAGAVGNSDRYYGSVTNSTAEFQNVVQ